MSRTIRNYGSFKYYEEDCLCEYCRYNKRKGKGKKHGCGRDICCCEDIRADAVANGRIKRERGWNKWQK
ncbi:MAG: hypothetical protein FWH49_08465 [Clostridiales bacterium]|nr:hypothetical protein [Clostridiales bacterium]